LEPHHFYPFAPFFWGLFTLAIVIVAMALKHRRRMAQLEMFKLYLAQNREPPADMLRYMHGPRNWHSRSSRLHRAIFFGSLAVGLGLAHLVLASLFEAPGHSVGLLIGAIVLGCLAAGQIISALLIKSDDSSPPSS